MAEPLVFTSDLLWPLAAFGTLHEGPAAYFGELSRSDDPVLAVGAICALVDNRVASVAQW